jgi:hypothetical protein
MSIPLGGSKKLQATFTKDDGTPPTTTLPGGTTLTWTSSDNSVSAPTSTSDPGTIIASGASVGTAVYTCKASNGAGSDSPGTSATGTITVNVVAPPTPAVTAVSIAELTS